MTIAEQGMFNAEIGSSLQSAERLLRTPPPEVSEAKAQDVAREYYGRNGKAQMLSGERDRNFLLTEANGQANVLKFYNSAEDGLTRALQHSALRHVHTREPGCPVPEIQFSVNGDEEVIVSNDDVENAMAMISLLPGVNPVAADLSSSLRTDLGRIVGLLSRALADYEHPSATRTILWDMMLVADLRPLTGLIAEAARRASVEQWLTHFATCVRPATANLPCQVIHNDLSLSNILIAHDRRDKITGIIDFGDIVRAPRINEFAIAASYFVMPSADPVWSIAEILRGAGQNLTFLPEEIRLMPDLVRARLATRILLSEWRARLFPDNAPYIMRSNLAAWRMWECLEMESAEVQSRHLLSLVNGAR